MTTKSNKKVKSKSEMPVMDDNFGLWVLFDQTEEVISKARDLELDQFKLTQMQAKVLFMLTNQGDNGGMTLSEISKWLLREPHSVLSLVNRMEKIGLVKRLKKSGDDKVRVFLTDKARALYSQTTRRSISMIFSALSQKDRQQLQSCLKQLRDKARSLLGMDYKPPFLP